VQMLCGSDTQQDDWAKLLFFREMILNPRAT
jgi:hypothetical protein